VEVLQPKPKPDVLLAGAIVFARPITEIDVELIVGTRLPQAGARVRRPDLATGHSR